MKKKIFMTLTLVLAMSTSMFAQSEPVVIEEGGTGPYKAEWRLRQLTARS